MLAPIFADLTVIRQAPQSITVGRRGFSVGDSEFEQMLSMSSSARTDINSEGDYR
jgi:hypothetical protein